MYWKSLFLGAQWIRVTNCERGLKISLCVCVSCCMSKAIVATFLPHLCGSCYRHSWLLGLLFCASAHSCMLIWGQHRGSATPPEYFSLHDPKSLDSGFMDPVTHVYCTMKFRVTCFREGHRNVSKVLACNPLEVLSAAGPHLSRVKIPFHPNFIIIILFIYLWTSRHESWES